MNPARGILLAIVVSLILWGALLFALMQLVGLFLP